MHTNKYYLYQFYEPLIDYKTTQKKQHTPNMAHRISEKPTNLIGKTKIIYKKNQYNKNAVRRRAA